ncbi:MAG: penicillin-binding protein 1B [Pseudomonadota bacterium]
MAKSPRSKSPGKPAFPVKPAAAGSAGFWPPLRRFLWRAGLALLVVFLVWVAWLDAAVTRAFESHRWTLPARVYARPLDLYAGKPLTAGQLLAELRELGYREVAQPAGPGEFAPADAGNTVRLVTRGFSFPEGATRAQTAAVTFSEARIEKLTAAERVLRIEPVVIGTIRPRDAEDRVLMRLEERPPYLVETLFAIEDRDFPEHAGVSPRGILRALFVNVQAGQVQQGGSTLTQQLVKNLFLGDQRTLARKATEAVMAVLLEAHYDKNTILETYCNEIYLGQAGQRAVHGFALGSQYYFGRPVQELKLHEVALLVGLVKGPSQYNPWKHADRALERRNLVLDTLAGQGIVDAATAGQAKAQPLGVVPAPRLRLNRYPAYMTIVRNELRQRLPEDALERDGLAVYTSLDPGVQLAAETALADELRQIERAHGLEGLEGSLVVALPQTGEIEAAVGGRDVDYAGFNRVTDARRTIGSLMKPVVFLEALSRPDEYSLASYVSDAPVEAKVKGSPVWRPANYDHVSHGDAPDHNVMLVDALANSWNQSTARLGLAVGVGRVIAQARRLGVEAELPPYPSVLLGSATLSPLEVLGMYQPIASGGLRVTPRAVRGVLSGDGEVLLTRATGTERVMTPATAYLLTFAMQETLRRGTAKSAYTVLPPALNAAGKTGTTDDARDSWFAGFSGNHLAVAWVGFDDNRATPLSGASGALPVWTDFMARLPQVALADTPPAGVETVWLEPGGRTRSGSGCAGAVHLPVVAGTAPEASTICGTASGAVDEVKGFFRRLVD